MTTNAEAIERATLMLTHLLNGGNEIEESNPIWSELEQLLHLNDPEGGTAVDRLFVANVLLRVAATAAAVITALATEQSVDRFEVLQPYVLLMHQLEWYGH